MATALHEQTDAGLAKLARQGDLGAFEQLYRRYFPRVFDYAARATRNRADAGDVAQDTFVRAAMKIGQLRNPDSFRSWLFAIARRQVLNQARAAVRTRPESPLEGEEGPGLLLSEIDEDRFSDPAEATASAELASLVWEAASALDERTYAVLDLHVRQGLDSAEIAVVMGVSKNNGYVMVNRMKARLGGAVSTYLLIRKGSKDCGELAAVVAGADLPPVKPELKRRVDRHVDSCDTCEETRRRLVAPMNVLAALANVAAEAGLEDAIWKEAARNFRSPHIWGGRMGRAGAGGLLLGLLLVATIGVAEIAPDPTPSALSAPADVASVTVTAPTDEPPAVTATVASNQEEDKPATTTPPSAVVSTTTASTTATAPTTSRTTATITTAAPTSTTTTTAPTSTTTTTAPTSTTTTAAPTTTTTPTTTTIPDRRGPLFQRVAASPNPIWERSATGCATSTQITAAVADSSGVGSVEATWTLAEGDGGTTLTGAGTYVGTFGPVPSFQSVVVTITATDTVGNSSTTTLDIVVLPASRCR